MASDPPPESDRIGALAVRMDDLEQNQQRRTWPGAIADGVGVVALATLGVLDKIDGTAAAVIIALVLGARIPSSKKGGIFATLGPAIEPFLRMFGWKVGA